MQYMTDTIEEPNIQNENERKLITLTRALAYSPVKGKFIDNSVVAFKYYNCFNYPFLSKENRDVYLTMGITSPNPREGKTLVASNLAVSLAMGYQKRTILVDMNLINPRLHEIFGTSLSPGLYEAMTDGTITVTQTQVDNLGLLSAGAPRSHRNGPAAAAASNGTKRRNGKQERQPPVGLEFLPAFREVLATLEQEFDFIIVDMPPINSRDFPVLYASQLNGLVVVVDTGKTRKDDVEKMFRQVNEQQVLGFVFNRVDDTKR